MSFLLLWLTEQAHVVSALASLGMLLVWLFYARLLYRGFRRQRRPFIFIHHVPGEGLAANCLVVNLSTEPIHILCVTMIVHTDKERFAARITQYQRLAPDQKVQERNEHQVLIDTYKQGPLPPGYFLNLDSFETMLKTVRAKIIEQGVAGETTQPTLEEFVNTLISIELCIIAAYGHYTLPVGASRTFKIGADEQGLQVYPTMLLTKQMNSHWQRREMLRWLGGFLR